MLLHLSPADGVVEATAETPLAELREALRAVGQAVPYVGVPGFAEETDSLGDLILDGYPHPGTGRFGGWTDWLLGATMRLPDGSVGRTGSRVVKSVAGYDVHRMLVGSRGALGVYESVALRTLPLALAPEPRIETRAEAIQRVLPSLYREASGVVVGDPEGAFLWWASAAEVDPHRGRPPLAPRRAPRPHWRRRLVSRPSQARLRRGVTRGPGVPPVSNARSPLPCHAVVREGPGEGAARRPGTTPRDPPVARASCPSGPRRGLRPPGGPGALVPRRVQAGRPVPTGSREGVPRPHAGSTPRPRPRQRC